MVVAGLRKGTLDWNLAEMARAMKITPEDARAYFTDGRRISFILERRIASEVLGGRLAPSEGAGFDLYDADGGKWEVRSITRGGIYFCPSYMVGSGRSFNEPGFVQKLNDITGYIVSDIELFPQVPYWILPATIVRDWWTTGQLGSWSKITRDKALSLIGRM